MDQDIKFFLGPQNRKTGVFVRKYTQHSSSVAHIWSMWKMRGTCNRYSSSVRIEKKTLQNPKQFGLLLDMSGSVKVGKTPLCK